MTNLSGFGNRLKTERERLGFTQAEFSQLGGVSERVQQRYEKEGSQPDLVYLGKVAALGVDILYVVTGQRTPKGTDTLGDDEARLVKNYNQVDSTGKTAAQQLLSTLAEAKKRAA